MRYRVREKLAERNMSEELSMRADEVRELRRKREYQAIKGFYIHFIVYAAVMALLVAIDVLGGEPMWSHWVAIGWGIGIAFHAYAAFIARPRRLAAWEREQMAHMTPAEKSVPT